MFCQHEWFQVADGCDQVDHDHTILTTIISQATDTEQVFFFKKIQSQDSRPFEWNSFLVKSFRTHENYCTAAA